MSQFPLSVFFFFFVCCNSDNFLFGGKFLNCLQYSNICGLHTPFSYAEILEILVADIPPLAEVLGGIFALRVHCTRTARYF